VNRKETNRTESVSGLIWGGSDPALKGLPLTLIAPARSCCGPSVGPALVQRWSEQGQTRGPIPSHSFRWECTERGSRVKGLRLRCDERAQNARP
jgi:hypothetical protein